MRKEIYSDNSCNSVWNNQINFKRYDLHAHDKLIIIIVISEITRTFFMWEHIVFYNIYYNILYNIFRNKLFTAI